jgi:enterochelin esterase family protein
MRSPQTSVVEVPGDPPRVWEFQDVPHGTVRVHAYHSKSLGKRRGLYVYTPPGYDRDTGGKYPVLYLLHGAGDNEATWAEFGRAHWILDNLLAQKKARPMLVVMPNGHAAPARPRAEAEDRRARTAAFERDLLEDVLPFVESHYRVRQEPGGRAVAGLSMGGGQSLSLGLNHPEVFAWVGAFSSAVFEPERTLAKAFDNPEETNDRLRLFWIACGKQDFLMDRNREFDAALKKHGIRHEFHETEGNHSWPVWRRYLAQFAPLLFQAEK